MSFQSLENRKLLTVFSVTNLDDDGDGSLRQAILDSNDSPGEDVISFADSLAGTISLVNGELNITDDLVINGPGAEVLTVSGSGLSRVLNVDTSTVAINDLTIADGLAGETLGPVAYGGGILNQGGVLTATGMKFVGNHASGLFSGGGAIASVMEASTTVVDSSFFDNSVSAEIVGAGGAIAIDMESTFVVTGSTFTGNLATGQIVGSGGAIINLFGSQLEVADATFEGNLALGGNSGPASPGAEADGGAISNVAVSLLVNGFVSPSLTVVDSSFVENISHGGDGGDGGDGEDGGRGGPGSGAAIMNIQGHLEVRDSSFLGNMAVGGSGGNSGAGADGGDGERGRGGAINSTGFSGSPASVTASLNIVQSEFVGNTTRGGNGGNGGDGGSGGKGADGEGGALRIVKGTAYISQTRLMFNEAIGGDGGIPGAGGNVGEGGNGLGGAIYIDSDVSRRAVVTNIFQTSIVNNRAVGGTGSDGGDGLGGGIYYLGENATITLRRTNINANQAIGGTGSGVGGGVYNAAGTVHVEMLPNIHGNKASTSHDDVFGTVSIVDDLLLPVL